MSRRDCRGFSLILIRLCKPALISTLLYVFLVGAGYGDMLSVALVATVAAVPHHDQAVPTSATYAFRSTGSTTGVTIASAVNQN